MNQDKRDVKDDDDVKDAEVERSVGHSNEDKASLFQHHHTKFLGPY